MTTVRVAVPVFRGKRRFIIDKGRPWSVVEHAILASLVRRAQTADELAANSNLPRRMIIEIAIRLMRAGWVELSQSTKGITYHANQLGKVAATLEELPNLPKRLKRWISFGVDRITGTLYRRGEITLFEKHVLEERADRERLVWITPRELTSVDDVSTVFETLFFDDERFIGIEDDGGRLVDRYMIATVHDGRIDDLPNRAPSELRSAILEAATQAPSQPVGTKSPSYSLSPSQAIQDRDPEPATSAAFDAKDLILGGAEHWEAFRTAISRSRYRVIIHSTFIGEDHFHTVQPLLLDAAKRGVRLDILWGENEDKIGWKTSRATVERLRNEIVESGHSAALRVHPFSTHSHAKIIVADNGNPEQVFAYVGSCNWLSSSFKSFEASVRVRDPKIVANVLFQIAELTRGSDGHWTDLTSETARFAEAVRRGAIGGGPRAEIALVLGPQHAHYVRRARDEAERRLFVTSHRMGSVGRPAIVKPAVAAANDRGIATKVYYGTVTGGLTGTKAADLTMSFADEGVRIRPVARPRLHAKLLAWDDDFLVVTSQNWLSADPTEANLRREIGVFLHGKNLARTLVEHFEARTDLS